MGASETEAGGAGGVVAVGTGVGGCGVAVGAGGCGVAVGAGGCGVAVGTGGWVGACVGAVVAAGATVGTVVATAFVAVGAGGLVAVGDATLVVGCLVAVGAGALLSAVLDDGFVVAVGVANASNSAALGESELPTASWSSGAAGGGFSTPSAESELPVRSDAVAPVFAELPPPRMPVAARPPAIVSVPPATKTIAIVRGLMMSLLVPL